MPPPSRAHSSAIGNGAFGGAFASSLQPWRNASLKQRFTGRNRSFCSSVESRRPISKCQNLGRRSATLSARRGLRVAAAGGRILARMKDITLERRQAAGKRLALMVRPVSQQGPSSVRGPKEGDCTTPVDTEKLSFRQGNSHAEGRRRCVGRPDGAEGHAAHPQGRVRSR